MKRKPAIQTTAQQLAAAINGPGFNSIVKQPSTKAKTAQPATPQPHNQSRDQAPQKKQQKHTRYR